jgi:hypothetical protein
MSEPRNSIRRSYNSPREAVEAVRHLLEDPLQRNSIRPTYDSRETGDRYWVTTEIGDRTLTFQRPSPDPFVRQTITVGWPDLIRGLFLRRLVVTVIVGGDKGIVDDVLELDENTLIAGSTRRAAFDSHINESIGRFIPDGEAVTND